MNKVGMVVHIANRSSKDDMQLTSSLRHPDPIATSVSNQSVTS